MKQCRASEAVTGMFILIMVLCVAFMTKQCSREIDNNQTYFEE
jgi:hypothetical protein